MAISLLHTPEGVRDLYNEECAKKETVSAKIGAVFHRFGYRSIQTPSYEFFDIFNKDRGSVASNQMFKFFDRDGNTLVLRPDITPSIARCAAKYFMDEDMPVRLCYNGNIFINNMSLRGSLKESTVMGAEMLCLIQHLQMQMRLRHTALIHFTLQLQMGRFVHIQL